MKRQISGKSLLLAAIARRGGALAAAIAMWPVALHAQAPTQSAQLIIVSKPVGADVMINRKKMNQPTNATFVVPPGKYVVSVIGAGGALDCADTTVTLTPGQTLTVTCTRMGWLF